MKTQNKPKIIQLCLCSVIHIPAVPVNYRFFSINQNHQYFNGIKTSTQVKKVCSENIVPYLQTLKSLCAFSRGKFKTAVVTSGITLAWMQKFVPHAIEMLAGLAENNCIELLSGTWSNSLLPFTNEKRLLKQIEQYDNYIAVRFGAKPEVIFVRSPLCSINRSILFNNGKKAIITCSDTFLNDNQQPVCNHTKGLFPGAVFYINERLSSVLAQIDIHTACKSQKEISSAVFRKIRKNIPCLAPFVLVYQPTAPNRPFDKQRAGVWKKVMQHFLSDSGTEFIHPRDCQLNAGEENVSTNTLPMNVLHQFRQPRLWIGNNLQKEAVNKLMQLQAKMPDDPDKTLALDWERIQDMDYLYYMSTRFTEKDYADTWFNPYQSPYLAFINYMNALDDLDGRLTTGKIKYHPQLHTA